MASRILSQVARRLPEPARRAGRKWWFHLNPAAPPQLRMVRSLDEESWPNSFTLPTDYKLLDYSTESNEQWLQLLISSDEFGVLNEKHFQEQLLNFLVPQGAAFITYKNTLVACAAACALPAFLPSATLSYVLVQPEHRGHKLGHIVTAQVMTAARRAGFETIILHTDDARVPAIKTYLNLGFLPVLDASPDATARWEKVLKILAS